MCIISILQRNQYTNCGDTYTYEDIINNHITISIKDIFIINVDDNYHKNVNNIIT